MKTEKCDLCEENCEATRITTLREPYRIFGVEDICPTCMDWANKLKSDLLDEIGPKMRSAISERKYSLSARTPSWFRRLLRVKR